MIKARCDICGADCSENLGQLQRLVNGEMDACRVCRAAYSEALTSRSNDPRCKREWDRRDRWDKWYRRRILAKVQRARRLEIEAAKT